MIHMDWTQATEPVRFKHIMTKDIEFHDGLDKADRVKFCQERDIEYLPGKSGDAVYRLISSGFRRMELLPSQKVSEEEEVFTSESTAKFQQHRVLFVFRNDSLTGVVHFVDCNRKPVFLHLYSLLLDFETDLRELLTAIGCTNDDMLEFLEGSSSKVYQRSLEFYSKASQKEKRARLPPFHTFRLSELIALLTSKNSLSISEEDISGIRNLVMHFVSPITHREKYSESEMIFDITSFDELLTQITILTDTRAKLSNEILEAKAKLYK